MTNQVQFSIGQIVHHKLFDYYGVVFEVDPYFMLSESWYEQVAKSKPPKDQPWYHVLVHDAVHTTYVAQRNLEATEAISEINHPETGLFFEGVENGKYRLRTKQLQ